MIYVYNRMKKAKMAFYCLTPAGKKGRVCLTW